MPDRRHPWRTAAALLFLAVAAVAGTVLLGVSAPAQVFRAQAVSGSVPSPRAANEFGVRVASATGLRPGGDATVRVTYSNPFPHELVVRSQRIAVASPASACPASHLDLTRARDAMAEQVVVPARRTKSLSVVLSMRVTAPDACQGVRFTTTVTAQGRKK